MGFSRQEYQSGLPCPPPGDLPHPGIEPASPTLQVDSLPSEPPGSCSKGPVFSCKCSDRFPGPNSQLGFYADCRPVGALETSDSHPLPRPPATVGLLLGRLFGPWEP